MAENLFQYRLVLSGKLTAMRSTTPKAIENWTISSQNIWYSIKGSVNALCRVVAGNDESKSSLEQK